MVKTFAFPKSSRIVAMMHLLPFTFRSFLLLLPFLFCFSSLNAQSTPSPSNGWYTAKQIREKTWVINEPGINDNMYLLEGTQSALLIDAGFGLGNLRDFVKSLTSKPLAIVNTHAHPDHTGGNYQFLKVHVGAADLESTKSSLDPIATREMAKMVMKDIVIADSLKFPDTLHLVATDLVPINDGYIFKLGGRDVRVITLPGHSPGSLCLLDVNSKFLFTGDNSTETWLFFKDSLPVETYLKSLQKLNKSKSKFSTLFPGHGPPLSNTTVDELIACCQLILSGKGEIKPYHSFLGIDGVSCSYKSVTIAYDPHKVKIK